MGVRRIQLVVYLEACLVILLFQQCIVLGGPVRRSSRMIREVYPEIEPEKLEGNQAEVCIVGDVVYGAGEPVPAEQPCLKCKCQPPGVQCETTKCIKKPGCRAIHKSNKCCPEYQCECEHEGRLYANGERLETPPGGECKVCYCRGGEVQCAEVSCYIRTDCEGRTVPGQCCPKYDHCPPREPLIDRVVPYTTQPSLTSNALDYWSSLNISFEDDQQSTPTYEDKITEMQTESNTNEIQTGNETIHIHEIRLVDKGTQTDPIQDEINISKITIQEIIPDIKEIPITGPPKREINIHMHSQIENDSKITNKVDEVDKEYSNWSQEKENNISDLILSDTESDSSEILEIYHQPPPVLKIGDQLLFLKKGELVPEKDISTPVPVITIIGAEGLQRGTEDSGEFHEVPSQVQDPPKSDSFVSEDPNWENETTTEKAEPKTHVISLVKSKTPIDDGTKTSLSTIESFLFNLTQSSSSEDDDVFSESLDANTTMLTENVVNKIKSLTSVESTTDVAHLVQNIFITDINDTEIVTSNYEEQNASTVEEHSPTPGESFVTLLERIESPPPTSTEDETNATQAPVSQDRRYEDLGESKLKHDEEIPLDQNPEYPPIPDIMSPQNVDQLAEHLDAELAQASSEEPQLNTSAVNETLYSNSGEILTQTTSENTPVAPKVILMKSSKTVIGSNNNDKQASTSHPLINAEAALPTTLLKELAPSDIEEDGSVIQTQPEVNISVNNSTEEVTESDRSKETLESTSEESGENTTPQNKHASIILSVEDASVETPQATSESQELNLKDLVETISALQTSTEETKDKSSEKPLQAKIANKHLKKDVELINPQLLMQNLKAKNKTLNSRDKESENIFEQLNEELKSVPSRIIDNNTGNEDAEAEAIFRELLEEASSSTVSPTSNGQAGVPKGKQKESELLQRVSDTISQFQHKESKESLDTSIIGILRDFFSSQYKYYDKEN